MSETVGAYEIVSKFDTAGGGQCQWAFARKDGRDFFIKRFLAPKYPTEDSHGSKKTREGKRARCEAFERHHRNLMSLLSDASGAGSNLIVATDFFRDGSIYYKVTEKVDVDSLTIEDISRLPLEERLTIMISVASSVGRLHSKGIVHGDLKPDNILIQRDMSGKFVGRLIDFDNSFVAGSPPKNPEEVVGDLAFYSPELAAYIQGVKGVSGTNVTTASDVFALGLVFTRYAAGTFPAWDKRYPYAFQAVSDGSTVLVPDAVPSQLRPLFEGMLSSDPSIRPRIQTVFDDLKKVRSGRTLGDPAAAAMRPSGVTGKLTLKAKSESVEPSTEGPAALVRPHLKLSKNLESKPTVGSVTPEPAVETKPTLRIRFGKKPGSS
ncbi:MAG: protein kinase [Armatimonadetes bacterium]|nr:protein kinase [Armatimonadota bacterium]